MNLKKLFSLIIIINVGITAYSAIPAGYYYFAKNTKKAQLKTTLRSYGSPFFELEYGGGIGFTWEGFYKADNRNDTVVDMYSSTIRKFSGYAAVNGMHIEHSFPKSWWGGHENGAYKDLFHLYPADGTTNSTKNDLPLGEVGGTPTFFNGVSKIGKNGFGNEYTENCFEPADEFKGDFARSYFYISTIYEQLYPLWQSPMLDNNVWPVWKPWAMQLLLKWNRQDPVSSKELARQEVIYGIQGNRNPFIDYPDLAEYIWGADTTKTYPFPDETGAFMVSPRVGQQIDFGVILQTDNRKMKLHLQAMNLLPETNMLLQMQSSAFVLSKNIVSSDSVMKGIDIEIQFSPTKSGEYRDTLVISGAGLIDEMQIPLKGIASSDFITLEPIQPTPVGGTLRWISDPAATNYRLKLYQGDQEAGDLIISGYVEGSSWNKAIQLYNGTSRTIDLSKYVLQKQSNGDGGFTNTLKLSGNMAPLSTFTIVHKQAGASLLSKATMVTDSLLQFNGNDAVRLVRSGVVIDMVGIANGGADVYWGQDLGMQRKSFVTHPVSVFNQDEWSKFPMDEIDFLSAYQISLITDAPILLLDTLTGNNYSLDIYKLKPQATATYSVEAIRPDGNVTALNTMQIKSTALDAPLALEATDITTNSFTARWEMTDYAQEYLLKIFSITGKSDTTEIEGFNNVGSTGKPLPMGWTGTASGNYETATSSGISTPSVGLKNNGEWLQTKDYGQPVTTLTFMYRFPSAATGSSFLLDASSGNNWLRVDSIPYKGTTAKMYPSYSFTQSQNYTAFRFTFKKSSGNLAIDDVQVKYGHQDSTFFDTDTYLIADEYVFNKAVPGETYYYKVAALRDAAMSAWSETVKVTTNVETIIPSVLQRNPLVYATANLLHLEMLNKGDFIQIYDLTGVCRKSFIASADKEIVYLNMRGVLIVRISSDKYNFAYKIVK